MRALCRSCGNEVERWRNWKGVILCDACAPAKPTKYRSRRTEYGGREFDSRAEAAYAEMLDAEVEAGEVLVWSPQAVVSLGLDVRYRLDFIVTDADERVRGVEVKGRETARWRAVRRLWRKYGPFPLDVVRRRGRGFDLLERINPTWQQATKLPSTRTPESGSGSRSRSSSC